MLQELIEFCGESTDFLWMTRREQVTLHTIIMEKSAGRAFMLRVGLTLKKAIVELKVVYTADLGPTVWGMMFVMQAFSLFV